MRRLEQVRHTARVKPFACRTEQAYVYWAERYIRFSGDRPGHALRCAPDVPPGPAPGLKIPVKRRRL